jgi:hypothetical protein
LRLFRSEKFVLNLITACRGGCVSV